jgi:processive 1,2-diacylglycerol beta-glucosyltransferase
MNRRVLVLTSSTGSGHDMRAKAFAEWVRIEHGNAVKVRIEQIIENGSLLGRFGVWIYNTIHKNAPFLHNIYYHIVELFVFTHKGKVGFGGGHYRKLLQEFQPDTILSVHDSTNRGYFEDAKRLLGSQVRCVTYCGEFSGGYGFSRNWINPAADLFIARTHSSRDFAVKLGMKKAQTAIFHKLLPPASFEARIPEHEKDAALAQLGLDPKKFTVFLATGGYGANHHLDFLKAILPLANRVQAIVICGRNQKVYQRLKNWSSEHPGFGTYIEGYSNQVANFLQISSAIVTRGGANTTMEALHFGCPLLYNSLGGLMPQERCTVRYFLDQGAALMVRRPADLSLVLEDWAGFGPSYKAIKTRLGALHHEENPRKLIELILGGLDLDSPTAE